MIFKVGSKIRAKSGTRAYQLYGNAIMKVLPNCCGNDNEHGHVDYIDPLTGNQNGWNADWFEYVKENLTEVDYLDAFKDNFKDGV